MRSLGFLLRDMGHRWRALSREETYLDKVTLAAGQRGGPRVTSRRQAGRTMGTEREDVVYVFEQGFSSSTVAFGAGLPPAAGRPVHLRAFGSSPGTGLYLLDARNTSLQL